jgi:DNA repair exonuclease SbcCD nuclease subunit
LKEANIKVFYATGNHDPGDNSFRANMIKWPDNVCLFKEDAIKEIELTDEIGKPLAKIVGVGHKTKKEARNLVELFPKAEGDIPHIGLVHAMVTNAGGVERHDRYLPCTIEDMEDKNYTYWALGHIHILQRASQNCSIYYCGNLQGRHPRETGEKGGLLVTIDDLQNVQVEFRSFSTIQWEYMIVKELEGITSYTDLKNHLVDLVENYIASNNIQKRLVLRLELEGKCYLKEELQDAENLCQLEEDLKYSLNLLAVEVRADKLSRHYNPEAFKEGRHVLSKVLAHIQKLKNEGVAGKLQEIQLTNKSLKGQDKEAYLFKLLDGLEEEAVGRMAGDKQ